MERVGQTLNRTGYRGSGNATDLTKQILADPRVADFIQEHGLSQDEIKRSLPKFNQFLVECRKVKDCLLYTSPSPRDTERSRMPSSA